MQIMLNLVFYLSTTGTSTTKLRMFFKGYVAEDS